MLHQLANVLAEQSPMFWLPPQSSTTAEKVDDVFQLIYLISLFFFALIVGLMVTFVIRYRRKTPGQGPEKGAPTHNTPLELIWSGIPLILVIVIFYVGFRTYLDMRTVPANAYKVEVIGQKWKWQFEYPTGWIDEDLHVPCDRPIKLRMRSEDVIHSLYIPDFRVKMDTVPGRYSTTWFRAPKPGRYRVYCTEYCGTGHSDMLAWVVVHPPGEFEPWLEKASNFLDTMTPVEAGALLYKKRGCAECHSVDGSANTGPSFKGLWGRERVFTNAESVEADENYIQESILYPNRKVVKGYQDVMPIYRGRIKDREISAIIAYIESLGGNQ